MLSKNAGFATRQIHRGHEGDGSAAPVTMPIYQTSTFTFRNAQQGAELFAGERAGYIYTRLGNPNHHVVEARLADLEGGESAVVTASGMGAISAALWTMLQAGDHIVAGRVLYGCTYALLSHGMTKFGVEVDFVDTTRPEAVEAAIKPNTKLVFLETPSNPNLELCDIEAIANIAHKHGAQVLVDNTFCTPYLQRPLELGADIVVHSATKYLNGHGDVIAGFVIGKQEFIDDVRKVGVKDMTGSVLGPFETFLLLRGLETLCYRMDAHCRNATMVAEFLEGHEMVTKVVYPGLASHPQHELASHQMAAPGGMVSFEVRGGHDAAVQVIDHCKLISIAVSLGDIKSLIQHPASMTHSSYTPEELKFAGISDGLIRVSIGLEDPEDIIRDLDRSLMAVKRMIDRHELPCT